MSIHVRTVVPWKEKDESVDRVRADDLRKPIVSPNQRVDGIGDLRNLALAPLGDRDLRISGVALVRATLTVGAVALNAAIAPICGWDCLISIAMVQGKQRLAVLLPAIAVPAFAPSLHAASLRGIGRRLRIGSIGRLGLRRPGRELLWAELFRLAADRSATNDGVTALAECVELFADCIGR